MMNDLLETDYDNDEPDTAEQLLEETIKSSEDLKTGFSELDKYLRIQANTLLIVDGMSSHGKTTMMLNMLRNMIRNYPDKSFVFYSYKDSLDQILSKLITIELEPDVELKEQMGTRSYLAEIILQLKEKDGSISPAIEKAYNEVISWYDEGRLRIFAGKPSVEGLSHQIIELVKMISYLPQEKSIAAVFIDYCWELKSERTRVNRKEELYIIRSIIWDLYLDRRVKAAIIMEGNDEISDIEFDPHQILRISNQNRITILKNRNGVSHKTVDLTSYPDRFLITDRVKTNYAEEFIKKRKIEC